MLHEPVWLAKEIKMKSVHMFRCTSLHLLINDMSNDIARFNFISEPSHGEKIMKCHISKYYLDVLTPFLDVFLFYISCR
jgi:hypothetical protein